MADTTVYALRRFMEKMAAPAATPIDLPNIGPGKGVPAIKDVMTYMKQNPFSDLDELNAPSFSRVGPSRALAAAAAKPAPAAATPSWWEENVTPLMANAGNLVGQYGLPIAAGVGLGGLGAYGLSRLFSSKKDEEESSFPWLSTLLGMGGGGALAAYLANPANRQSAMQTYNRYTPLPTQTVKNDRAAEAAAGEEPFTTESLGDNPAMRAARG
jgi:hypothetical protein